MSVVSQLYYMTMYLLKKILDQYYYIDGPKVYYVFKYLLIIAIFICGMNACMYGHFLSTVLIIYHLTRDYLLDLHHHFWSINMWWEVTRNVCQLCCNMEDNLNNTDKMWQYSLLVMRWETRTDPDCTATDIYSGERHDDASLATDAIVVESKHNYLAVFSHSLRIGFWAQCYKLYTRRKPEVLGF